MNEITRMTTLRSGGSVDEFLQRATAVYDEQRKRIIELEAEHERKRTEVKSSYGRKLADVAHEGAEALRKLDTEHRRAVEDERGKLAAIERLRGVHNGG